MQSILNRCNLNMIQITQKFFNSFGTIFDNYFVKKDQKANALIVLQQLNEKQIDADEIKEILKSLPDSEWSMKVLFDNAKKLNSIFKLNDKEIKKYCVNDFSARELKELKWELSKQIILESSKYANNFYDALKYDKNEKLSIVKMKLLNEMMLTLKYIKESSQKLYNDFKDAKYSANSVKKFNLRDIPIEFLWLRILYIMVNIENKKIESKD